MESDAINPLSAYILYRDFQWVMNKQQKLVPTTQIPSDYRSFEDWFIDDLVSEVTLTTPYLDICKKTRDTC